MGEPKVVYEPTVGRWRVDSRLAEDSAWSELRRFSKPGKARKYAQQMKDEMASRRVRVVDVRPDEGVERWFVEYQEDDGTWCGGGSFPSLEEAKNLLAKKGADE